MGKKKRKKDYKPKFNFHQQKGRATTKVNIGRLADLVDHASIYSRDVDDILIVECIHRLERAWLDTDKAAIRPLMFGLGKALEESLAYMWERGWQPTDVISWGKGKLSKVDQRLLTEVISNQALSYYSDNNIDPEWKDQLDTAHISPPPSETIDWLLNFVDTQANEVADAMKSIVELLFLMRHSIKLESVLDSPATWQKPNYHRLSTRVNGVDPKVLSKVRAILAQAESTSFAEEAETFTAKAQELMAKYAIDHIKLKNDEKTKPRVKRIWFESPYIEPKSYLLAQVASANRCLALLYSSLGFSSLVGYAEDLEVVEILYTSLLVQANVAMNRPSTHPGNAGSRTTSFRRSFLVAYAARIGERLSTTEKQVITEAEQKLGKSLLPVLSSRNEEVEAMFQAMFPTTTSFSIKSSHPGGRAAGRAAANLASIAVGEELAST